MLGTDLGGARRITLEIIRSKTDKYKAGEYKVLKEIAHILFPARMFARRSEIGKLDNPGNSRVFRSGIRTRISAVSRMGGASFGIDGNPFREERVGSAMIAAG